MRNPFFLLALAMALSLVGQTPVSAQTPVPTFDSRADLDANGIINVLDLLIFQAAWYGTTMASATPTETFTETPTETLTPTATSTMDSGTPTETFTPSLTPTPTATSDLPGSVSGKITNQQNSEAIAFYPVAIVPDGMIGQAALSDFEGNYSISGFPVGVSATIRNNDTPPESRGFQAFETRFTIRENTVLNLQLVPLAPTNTPTPSNTPTETFTPSNTPTITLTFTPSNTPTVTNTPTINPTDTFTNTPMPTDTFTRTPTHTPTVTLTPSNTRTPTPTPVSMNGTFWTGTANLSNPTQINIQISMTGSDGNVTVTFISNRTYIDPPNISGTSFSFGPKQDSQGAGTQLELKDANFVNNGFGITGNVEYFTTMGALRTGFFTMNRIN